MKRWLLIVLLGAGTPLGIRADEPTHADKNDACHNNRILGPRTADRPLPLLAGDAAHGFRAACSVPWSTLSPKNQALPVVACFPGGLLQVPNDAACGRGTGPLWVSSRWVLTSADLQRQRKQVATCQQLETHAFAASRDYKADCEPRKKDLLPASESKQPAPSKTPPPESPAGSTPHPSR